MYVKY